MSLRGEVEGVQRKPILRMENIVKLFPGVKALDGARLEIMPGEIHALCGENGAGKSTLMKIIAGAQSYTSGSIFIEEEEVVFSSIKDAEKHGISMIYQEFNLISELSVAENMFLGRLPTKYGRVDWKLVNSNAQKSIDALGLHFSPKVKIKELSVAEAQMTEIAKCLAVGSKIMIMDEPTAALTEAEIAVLFAIIKDLKSKGISIIYISHRMDEIFSISDRITVFRDGKYIETKNTEDTNYDEIVSLMVGKRVTELYPARDSIESDVAAEFTGITGKNVLDVSFKLNRGEILGIAGLLGSGNIELSKLIYGALPLTKGGIVINGEKKDCSTPKKSLSHGIGFVSDDRKREGLILIRNVKENISLSSLDQVATRGVINKQKENTRVDSAIKELNIKVPSSAQLAGYLSGGNQQKVVFAKVLGTEPTICIFDEPTRGVDIGAKAEIYKIMDDLTKEGKSILLVSSDLPELIGMSDRVLVMRQGRIVKEMLRGDANQEKVLAYASGGVDEDELDF